MEFTVSKAELNKALQITQSASPRKTTMPILVNVLLNAGDDSLKISASDLEISTNAKIKAKVTSAGSTTVNAKMFSDIVKELPEGDVRILLTEGQRIEIAAGRSKFRVIGVSPEEFPSLPGLSLEVNGKIQTRQLSEMIGKTLYATSNDETRFNLSGVCFEFSEGSSPKIVRGKKEKAESDNGRALKLVATDGHRLSLITRSAGSVDFEGRIIVPKRGLSEIKRILDSESEAEVGVAVNEGFFLIETKSFKMAVALIDSEYPDYSQVIPKEKGTTAVIHSAELSQALRRAILMVTDKEKCARLTFSPDSLKISSSSPELGDVMEEIPVKYEGDVVSIGFNAQYLTDMAAAFGGEASIVMEIHGDLGPGKFFVENDESSLAIVMPMRL